MAMVEAPVPSRQPLRAIARRSIVMIGTLSQLQKPGLVMPA